VPPRYGEAKVISHWLSFDQLIRIVVPKRQRILRAWAFVLYLRNVEILSHELSMRRIAASSLTPSAMRHILSERDGVRFILSWKQDPREVAAEPSV
jgi:hypothetical protein